MAAGQVIADYYGPSILTMILATVGWSVRQARLSYRQLVEKVDRLSRDLATVVAEQQRLRAAVAERDTRRDRRW